VKKGRVRIRVMEEAGGKHLRSKSYVQNLDFKTVCRMVENLSVIPTLIEFMEKVGPLVSKSKR